MRTWQAVILSFALTVIPPVASAQKDKPEVPKYKIAAEAKDKGTVDEVKDRDYPVSGTMGSHLLVKIEGKVYEVHVAPTKFVKNYDVVFQKGDEVEITGIKTVFQGVDAILVREIKRGNDDFVFRDPEGKPIW